MQRRSSKQSPARNAEQKKLMDWIHTQPCAACGCEHPPGGHEGQHILGETYAKKIDYVKTNLGHWAVIALCHFCHLMATREALKFFSRFGKETELWHEHTYVAYFEQTGFLIDGLIHNEIKRTRK